jgi:bacillithiol biosynthesis cysteine-adding enzyme BshC
LILDYLNQDNKLHPFISHFPQIENFEKQIIQKKDHLIDRNLLVDVLRRQNNISSISESSKANINLLKLDTTFTVTTGHQLCLFTGPLYFIYKIISTINLCEHLRITYPNYNFIPIFWMATEDHDFKEVNHIHLFGNTIEWDTNQIGAVGEMTLDGFESVISELKLVLGNHKNAKELISLFEQTYLNNDNLTDATRYLVNELFGEYGLVIIDGNDKDLKRQFIPYIKKDVLESGFSSILNESSDRLAINYKAQALVRKINFFRLSDGKRELINEDVMVKEIEENPERFSPNVLLRPLYQEIILPNIAYVGGASELSYLMQLKDAFTQEKIPFPILVLRNSALLIDKKKEDKFEQLGFKLEDTFLSEHELNKRYVLAHSNSDISLEAEKRALDLLYQDLVLKTTDIGLKRSVKAQSKQSLNFFDKTEKKLIKNEKKKNEVAINQIAKIKKQLFPNNCLQERYENFITYYLYDGDNFIKRLKNNFNPLDSNFVILTLKD